MYYPNYDLHDNNGLFLFVTLQNVYEGEFGNLVKHGYALGQNLYGPQTLNAKMLN